MLYSMDIQTARRNTHPDRVLLDPRHKKFADNYIVTGQMSKSAVKAGYSPKSAHVAANRLIKRADVQQYLREQTSKVAEQTEDLQSRVVKELESIAFFNFGDFIRIEEDGTPVLDLSNATPEQTKAISSLASSRKVTRTKGGDVIEERNIQLRSNDKLRGLDLLGQTMGMYKQTQEHKVTLDVADRLLAARRRYMAIEGPNNE